MKTHLTYAPAILGLLIVFVLLGCRSGGPEEGTLTGRITYQGEPLPLDPQPRVFFQNDQGEGGIANLDANGNFTLENLRYGEYQVFFRPEYPFPPQPNAKELDIPKQYMSAETSGIVFTMEQNAAFEYDITH